MRRQTSAIAAFFRNVADAMALTTAERRVLQFLIAGFVIGLGVKLARELVASPTKFDYSGTDSTFAARSAIRVEIPAEKDEPPAKPEEPAGPVHVNRASKEELMSLPGVGEVMAERIMLERQDNGPFTSLDDLKRVRGIGQKRTEQLKPLVIID